MTTTMQHKINGLSLALLSDMQIRNEKAKRYLSSMRKKQPVPFQKKFPGVDRLALRLLERLLAFDPKDRPTAEEVEYIQLTQFMFSLVTSLPNKDEMNNFLTVWIEHLYILSLVHSGTC